MEIHSNPQILYFGFNQASILFMLQVPEVKQSLFYLVRDRIC